MTRGRLYKYEYTYVCTNIWYSLFEYILNDPGVFMLKQQKQKCCTGNTLLL